MPPTVFATMPKPSASPSGGSTLADPKNYVFHLDKSHVRIVETFNDVTAKVPRPKRREFQRKHGLDSSSPARWPFEALMSACAEFGIPPLLGVGGTAFAIDDLGLLAGSFRSVTAADGADEEEEEEETSSPTVVPKPFRVFSGASTAVVDEDDEDDEEDSSPADDEWFNEFFGLNDDAEDAEEPAPSTPRLAVVPAETPAAAPEERASLGGVFVEPQLDPHFILASGVEELLHTLDAMSRTEILNIALTGPTGTGKTSLPEWFAAQTRRPFFIFDTPTIREPKEALGYKDIQTDPTTGETKIVWQKSGLIQALETPGCVVVLDEVTRVHGSYMNSLLALLDHRKRVWLDEIQDTVNVAPGVIIFFTANIGATYTGTWTWDAAFENRIDFRVDIDYLRPEAEAEVLARKTGLDPKVAKAYTEIAQIIRARAQDPADALTKAVSTRQLLAAAKLCVAGMSPKAALEFTIVPTFSAEGGSDSDRAHVLQIIQGKLEV